MWNDNLILLPYINQRTCAIAETQHYFREQLSLSRLVKSSLKINELIILEEIHSSCTCFDRGRNPIECISYSSFKSSKQILQRKIITMHVIVYRMQIAWIYLYLKLMYDKRFTINYLLV